MKKISLPAARVNAGFTQDQVAAHLNIAVSTYRNWESGKTYPKLPQVDQLCELFGMPYDAIDFLGTKNFAV